MSEDQGGRRWIAVLAAMVVLTAACTVGYVLVPFDPPPAERVDRGAPGVVPPGERIVAVDDDGDLVILDAGDGTLSEIVRPGAAAGASTGLAVTASAEAAFLGGGRTDPRIRLVRLRSGEEQRWAQGSAPAIGRRHQPTVPVDERGPTPELLAFVEPGEGGDTIVVENITTGDRSRISTGAARPEVGEITELGFSPVAEVLYGIADGGRRLFRVSAGQDQAAPTFDVATPAAGVTVRAWLDLTVLADRVLAVARLGDGSTALVQVQTEPFRVQGTLALPSEIGDAPAVIDAGASGDVLLVTSGGTLWRWSLDAAAAPIALAERIRAAAW